MFVVALTIPEAWHDASGGLNGPLVLVGAFLLVRFLHLTVYAVAATGDPGLRRQVAISWLPTLAGGALLVLGLLVGGLDPDAAVRGALLVDWVPIYLTSRHGNWRVHSAGHWSERHGLFIILALGESVVAIGLWWLYFDMVSLAAEHQLLEAHGQARAKLAVEAYTYGHFPIVAGIVLAALGVEGVVAHAGEREPLGVFYAFALFGGVALYLALASYCSNAACTTC